MHACLRRACRHTGDRLAAGAAGRSAELERAALAAAPDVARARAAQATEALRITSSELVSFGVMDTVIEEPLGGAHSDPMGAFPAIKQAILHVYNSKCGLPSPLLLHASQGAS